MTVQALRTAIEAMALVAAAPEGAQVPIPMLLFCPACGTQHVDAPESAEWTNPPHRSHLCHNCGCIWRPADVPTIGVERIETRGKADTWDGAKVKPEGAQGAVFVPSEYTGGLFGPDSEYAKGFNACRAEVLAGNAIPPQPQDAADKPINVLINEEAAEDAEAARNAEALTESEKDMAVAQAVELVEYVTKAAKGEMVKAAQRFLSLPYSQEIAARLKPETKP